MVNRKKRVLNLNASSPGFSLVELLVGIIIFVILALVTSTMFINFVRNQRAAAVRDAAYNDAQLVRNKGDICMTILTPFQAAFPARVDLLNRKLIGVPPGAPAQMTEAEADGLASVPILKIDGTAVRTLDYDVRARKRNEAGQLSFTYILKHKFLAATERIYNTFPGATFANHFEVFTEVREGMKLFIDGICDNPI